MKSTLKIANTQAFWGDRFEASAESLAQIPDLDYLTLDYLSEVSLSIMAVQREKDPLAGYAKDFVDVIKSLMPFWNGGSKVKVITNAGGLNPKLCAKACMEVIKQSGNTSLKIAFVCGDDVVKVIKGDPSNSYFNNLETGDPILSILDRLTTANAYLGAKPIADALALGADIIITGRIADPSMTVAPCMAHFGWAWTDYNKIAQATVAGHLIECGTQLTGGISTDWLSIEDVKTIGFPVVEIDKEANVLVTKYSISGGNITVDNVKEQLIYEIGNPEAYLSPDVIVSFLNIKLEQQSINKVSVSGATGQIPPISYKVSATYRDGYRAEGMLAIYGRDCEQKARRCGEVIAFRMEQAGYKPEKYLVECLGCGDVVPGVIRFGTTKKILLKSHSLECILRICVADQRKEVVEYFSKQMAPLVTGGPPGTTGYTTGRPHARRVYGYWPCLVKAFLVFPIVELFEGEK